jgi:type IV secretion system protein VirB9
MIRVLSIPSSCLIALIACAATTPIPAVSAAEFQKANVETERPAVRVVEIPKPLPLPGLLLLLLPQSRARAPASPPMTQVDAANRAALREPSQRGYINAVQVYPWSEGALYRLYAAPEQVSDIALQPGESLTAVAAGDTVRWVIGDTTSGSGPEKRTHVLVKPFAPGLKSNLVITTDRRSYHLQLESTARTAIAALSWTYPQDELLALKREAVAAEVGTPVASGIAIENLRFGYSISGDRPSWRPLRAFDDGRQTFIEFPGTLGQGEAPPLFVLGARGDAQLVNYRVRGSYYIVDRLFAAAELRLGAKRQEIVRISRDDGGSSARGRRQRRGS